MRKDIFTLLIISSILIFIAEAIFVGFVVKSLANDQSNSVFWLWTGLLIGVVLVSLLIGGVIMYIGDRDLGGDGYLMTISYGYMIPFLAPLSLYFIYRYNKEK